jgi:hypothetical protein
MAEPHEPEDDVLELNEELQVEHEPRNIDDDTYNETGEGDETFSFGDEPEAPEEAPTWAKHLRSEHARIAKENRELRQQVAARQIEEAPIVVGPRPKAWDEGIDGDDEKLDAALDAWEAQKTAAAEQERKRDEAKRRQNDEWGKVQARYNEEKARITVPGRDEAESVALAELSPQQQAVIARHADNPARFIIALGKNPAKLAQIASIEDPFALTKAMTKMEATLKQTKGPRPPEPSRTVRGAPISTANTNKQLEKLEAEAEKTGNRDKVIAFKRAQREKSK